MRHTQTIGDPHGVTVLGSAVVRLEPDFATVRFTVRAVNRDPKTAVATARNSASSLSTFLQRGGVSAGDIKISRVAFKPTSDGKSLAQEASLECAVTIRELDRIESILVGLLDAGVTHFEGPFYQTSKIRDARAEARQSAVLAAFKKAELFAEAAGVEIGRVLHIEEVDASELGDLSRGHLEEFPGVGGYSPTALEIAASAFVSFAIKGGGQPEITGQYRVI